VTDAPFPMQPTVVEAYDAARREGRPLVACDVSPPRGAEIDTLPRIAEIPADLYCVAYAPGRAVRLDSLAMATVLRAATGRGTIWNLATRDMNKLALQNHLLGAQALGQPNVAIVRGDEISERDRSLFTGVYDYTPSALVGAAVAMNAGQDFRGSALRAPTRLCVGATLDLARGSEAEAKLTGRKARAGAMFFLTQPVYSPEEAERFLETYRRLNGEVLEVPVLWGFPVLAKDSITFGEVPAHWREQLDAGRSGTELAAEELARFIAAGLPAFYVMPPILRGGARDYVAAGAALRQGLHQTRE
jgi:5,10-methylenetetrahydrofolate reductase